MIFITSYECDYVTSNLHTWSLEIYNFAKDKGINVVHFHDGKSSKATKDNVENYLSRKNPKFVFLNGHGNEENVNGYKDKPIVSFNNNEHLLKNKIAYIVACKCGEKLAPSLISKGGAKSVIGYKKKFCMPLNEGRECTPLKNDMVTAIKEISNAIPKSIIKGRSIKESINSAKIQWSKWKDTFENQDPSSKAQTLLWVLNHNINCLDYFGDGDTSISY